MKRPITNEELVDAIDISKLRQTPQSLKMSVSLLNNIISFIYKKSTLRTRRTLRSINELMSMIDMKIIDEQSLISRIWLIKKSLSYVLEDHIDSVEMMVETIESDPDYNTAHSDIIKECTLNPITHNDSLKLLTLLSDRLNYGYNLQIAKVIESLCKKIDRDDYRSCKSIDTEILKIARAIVAYHNKNNLINDTVVFSLRKDNFDNSIEYAHNKLTAMKNQFITGMRLLNILLSPGFESGRLYCVVALPGGGKSQLMLNIAMQIRNNNNNPHQRFPDKTPAILYLSLENLFEESFERLCHIAGLQGEMYDYSVDEVKKNLRTRGLVIDKDKPMDLIMLRERRNQTGVDDIRQIYNRFLEDYNTEFVMIIIDYLQLIKCRDGSANKKPVEQYKEITDDLKDLSEELGIPVFVAHQINRTGSGVIDAAIDNNSYDLAKKITNQYISDSWDILKNVDFLFAVHIERHQLTGQLYMGFSKNKKRYYKKLEEDESMYQNMKYFAQPYYEDNEIRLMEDVNLDYSLGLTTLKPTVDDIRDTIDDNSKKKKKKEKNIMLESSDIMMDFGLL